MRDIRFKVKQRPNKRKLGYSIYGAWGKYEQISFSLKYLQYYLCFFITLEFA